MTSKQLLEKARHHYPDGFNSIELILWDHEGNRSTSTVRLWIGSEKKFIEASSMESVAAALDAEAPDSEEVDRVASEIDAATHPAVEEVITKEAL